MSTLRLVVVLVAILATGCSSSSKSSKSSGQVLSGTDEQLFIGDTVEKNYDPNVILKRAEAFFEKEDYPEAIIEYQHFLDLHRVHVLAPYAQFKLAESFYKQIRTIDRDIEPVYKAIEAYEKLRRDFPGSRYEAEAVDRIAASHHVIVEHYLFVADFYYRKEAYLAAAHRYEAVLTKYPDMDLAADALYHLARAYKEMGADNWAREKLMVFAQKYPEHKFASTGQKLLARLNAKQPPTAVARATTPHADGGPELPPAIHAGAVPRPTPAPSSGLASTLTAGARANHAPVTTTLCRLGTWC